MSAVVGEPAAPGSQKYVNFDEYVDFQVNKTRSGIRHTDLLLAVVTVLLVVAGYLLAFVVADQWVVDGGFSYWPRVAMLAAIAGFIGFWTSSRIILPYWRRVTALYAARELEQTQPGLKSTLLTLVDLKHAEREVAPHVLTAMEKRAALQLSQIDVEHAVDRRPLMRLAYALFGVVLAFCVYTVLSPKPIGASILRALIPVTDVGVATRTRILKVEPGQTTILARSQLEVTVDLGGEIPPEATLLYTTRDRSLVDEPVILRDTGEGLNRFRGTLSGPNGRGLLQDFQYRVTAGDAEGDSYAVRVIQAPYATVESIAYAYPSYMGLDPKTQSGGDIDAWEGTQVTLRAVTNMPVAGAILKQHDTEDTSLRAEENRMRLVDETHLEFKWTLAFRSDGTFPHYYSIDLKTSDGQTDPVPRLYGLTIRRDLPPEIKLLHPSGDVELPANAVLPISFTARDPDFMLRSVRMLFEKRDQAVEGKTRHLYDAPPFQSDVQGSSEIELESFELNPGDVLTFWLEAWDNMAPLMEREGNRTVTPKINITITAPVTADEVEQRRAEDEAAAQQKLEEAQSQQAAEPGTAEPTPDDGAQEETGTESADPAGAAPDSQPADNSAAETATDDQPAGAGSSDNATGDQTPQPATGQQSKEQDPSSQGQPQSGAGQSNDGAQSQPNGTSPQKSGDSGKTDPNGTSGAATQRQQRGTPQPGQEATDDEALSKFLEKYSAEIKQQQRKQQQDRQRGEGAEDDGQQATGDSQAGGQPKPGDKPQQQPSEDDGTTGTDGSSDKDQPDGDGADESSTGTKPRQGRTPPKGSGDQPSETGEDQPRDGNAPQERDAQSPGKRPDERQQSNGGSQNSRDNSDPRANQDPRTAEEQSQPRGQEASTPSDGKENDSREQSTPMPGDGNAAESTKPSSEASQGQPSAEKPPSGEPSGKTPQGENSTGDDQPAQPDRTGLKNPNPANDLGGIGTNDQEPTDPSKTGNQPEGANESDPGPGRKAGQRSEQPSAGEQGSSQQASEGTPGGEQKGQGEQSQSPGTKSEGESGQTSPGQGKPSNGQPGKPSDGGSQSQPSPSGESGDKPAGDKPSQQPGGSEAGSESDSAGDQQGAESPPGSGEKPGSKTGDDTGKPGAGERGQPGDEQSQPGDQPGEKGAGEGEQQNPNDDAGGEQSADDGQKPGGGQKKPAGEGNQEGGGQPSDAQQGGKGQGEGSKGKGEGESGGSEGSGSEGSPSEGSGSSKGGEAPPSTQPGSGQAGGGKVGTGGFGQHGTRPQTGTGSGDDGGAAEADPADLNDKKRATELVLQRLQDEMSRGEVSEELLQELGWTEDNLRQFMDRLDERLSDRGEDQSDEAQARRRQFTEILRGIEYSSAGRQKTADGTDRPVDAGSGVIPRRPAPAEFRGAEEGLKQKQSRQTKSK